MCMIGNHVYGQPYRGFESPPLRQSFKRAARAACVSPMDRRVKFRMRGRETGRVGELSF
jgi:hypothetical protein